MERPPPKSTLTDPLFPYATLFRSCRAGTPALDQRAARHRGGRRDDADRAQAARAEPGAGIAAAIAVDRGGGGRDRGGRLSVVDGGRGAADPIVRRSAAGAARDLDRARGADLAAGDGGGANGVSWSGGLTRGARCIIVAV